MSYRRPRYRKPGPGRWPMASVQEVVRVKDDVYYMAVFERLRRRWYCKVFNVGLTGFMVGLVAAAGVFSITVFLNMGV